MRKPKLLDPSRANFTKLDRSRKQEKAVGGKVVVGSGNQWHSKGDVELGELLVECKRTDKESYRLQLAELQKIKLEAAMEGKTAVMQVEISGKKFAVIDWATFESYRSE